MYGLTKQDYSHAVNIKELLKKEFNDLISIIYCYGSRVTKQTQNTDFDIVVITSEKIDWNIEDKISGIIYYYGLKNDILFGTRCFSKDEFENKYSYVPFITSLKNNGMAV